MDIPKRNIYIFSSSGREVAGFFQHGAVSIETAVRWIMEVCRMSAAWTLYPCADGGNSKAAGPALDCNSQDDLPPGSYVIRTLEPEVGPVSVSLTPDTPRTRAYPDPPDPEFATRVKARDRRCCISGIPVTGDDFVGFQVAYIFPPGETDLLDTDSKRLIQDSQGFLCTLTEYERFDAYLIGINPDDDYRIYEFVGRDPNATPHGRTFYQNLGMPQHCLPSAELLRGHFRQCVLKNVKGAGTINEEPYFNLGQVPSASLWSTTKGGRVGAEDKTPLRETTLRA